MKVKKKTAFLSANDPVTTCPLSAMVTTSQCSYCQRSFPTTTERKMHEQQVAREETLKRTLCNVLLLRCTFMFSSVAAVEPSLPRRGILQNTVTSALLSQVLQYALSSNCNMHNSLLPKNEILCTFSYNDDPSYQMQ